MADDSKIRRDKDTGYPKYDRFKDYGKNHTHEWGGYSRNGGKYYEGGHGENISKDSKIDSGRGFRKQRGD